VPPIVEGQETVPIVVVEAVRITPVNASEKTPAAVGVPTVKLVTVAAANVQVDVMSALFGSVIVKVIDPASALTVAPVLVIFRSAVIAVPFGIGAVVAPVFVAFVTVEV
jgi:hypothetical protein